MTIFGPSVYTWSHSGVGNLVFMVSRVRAFSCSFGVSDFFTSSFNFKQWFIVSISRGFSSVRMFSLQEDISNFVLMSVNFSKKLVCVFNFLCISCLSIWTEVALLISHVATMLALPVSMRLEDFVLIFALSLWVWI